ncbi:MAG TPA: GNAT family protein [Acidimicrobiales bacterium]|jgi:ribosomal-protein-alanine N-acetyltransferase|nr:GNAT family protein [Acidimicrobiales bacterium]
MGPTAPQLTGRRVRLRPLTSADFAQWQEVRRRCRQWLEPWEPRQSGGADVVEDRRAFAARCGTRERERQLGTGYSFGIFVGDRLVGEANLSSVQRWPLQSAYVGYWVDQAVAGRGYVPEAVAVLFRFAFEEVDLHRLQVSIIPRNVRSRRVAEKLGLREEGVAERYLEINGQWEDHVRYAITAEEWAKRRDAYLREWILP